MSACRFRQRAANSSTQLGIVDTSQLDRVVTGFNSNVTYYGTAIYTIRGVGFQDTALASGADGERLRRRNAIAVLGDYARCHARLAAGRGSEGPAGYLFGQNATGGAINYVANKPTRTFEAGVDASYGRFDRIDVDGFVSGPSDDTLRYRLAGARDRDRDRGSQATRRTQSLPPDPYWTAADANVLASTTSGATRISTTHACTLRGCRPTR